MKERMKKNIITLVAISLSLSGCGIYTKYEPATVVPDDLYGGEVVTEDTAGLVHFLQFWGQKTDIRPCIVQFATSDISASRHRTSDDYSISFRFRPADAKKIYLHSTPGTIIMECVNRSYKNAAPTPCRPARVFVRGDGNVSIKEHTRCIRSLKRSR